MRHLRVSKVRPLCESWGGDGKSFQINGYYGFPTSETLRDDYNRRLLSSDASQVSYSSNNQYGLRMEKYVPSLITSNAVLGFGLDYSLGYHQLSYSTPTSTGKHFVQNNQVMLSMNHMTLVTGRFIGYLTLQGGINQISDKHHIISPIDSYQTTKYPFDFAYRVGYGFQYYPMGLWGIAVEGGYGDGAYVRAGLFWWFL